MFSSLFRQLYSQENKRMVNGDIVECLDNDLQHSIVVSRQDRKEIRGHVHQKCSFRSSLTQERTQTMIIDTKKASFLTAPFLNKDFKDINNNKKHKEYYNALILSVLLPIMPIMI